MGLNTKQSLSRVSDNLKPGLANVHTTNLLIEESSKQLSHFFLAAPAGTIILARTSLSFCKTINLASSINFPSGADPGTALCATCAATTTAGPGFFAPLALFLLCPIPDPQTTTHSSTFPCGGIVHPEQTLEWEAISACRLIVTRASIVAEE